MLADFPLVSQEFGCESLAVSGVDFFALRREAFAK